MVEVYGLTAPQPLSLHGLSLATCPAFGCLHAGSCRVDVQRVPPQARVRAWGRYERPVDWSLVRAALLRRSRTRLQMHAVLAALLEDSISRASHRRALEILEDNVLAGSTASSAYMYECFQDLVLLSHQCRLHSRRGPVVLPVLSRLL